MASKKSRNEMKKDQYFPLEVNMMNDERLAAVTEKYGAKGIGIYLVLLLELRKHENYRCGLNSIRQLARTYCLGIEVLERVIHDFGLFELNGEEDNLTIASPYLDRVMEEMEKKRKRCSDAGKKTSTAVKRDAGGRFTSIAGTNKYNDDDDVIQPDTQNKKIKNWKEYLAEALNDQAWLECQAIHSGLGARFVKYQADIAAMFVNHTITHGKDSILLSVADVKYYFANFIRQGTVTNKRVAKELAKLEQQDKSNDIYRYETVDPKTGERSYYGNVIPQDAPPRPNDKVVWNYESHVWE